MGGAVSVNTREHTHTHTPDSVFHWTHLTDSYFYVSYTMSVSQTYICCIDDNSCDCLFVWLANHNCLRWQVKCGGMPPTYRCISIFGLCDGDDDCGNGWDESPTMCGQLTELSYLLNNGFARQAGYFFYITVIMIIIMPASTVYR